MALRKHRPGELVIEQTRDLIRVREILASAGMMTEGIEWPAACYILAFNGDESIGVVGIEPKIDAALIRSLFVKASMRRRGIGAALVAAARKSRAHSRRAPPLSADQRRRRIFCAPGIRTCRCVTRDERDDRCAAGRTLSGASGGMRVRGRLSPGYFRRRSDRKVMAAKLAAASSGPDIFPARS